MIKENQDDEERMTSQRYFIGGVQVEREDLHHGFLRRGEHYGRGPKGWKYPDRKIKEDACEALAHNHLIDASEIEVFVNEGNVHLRGKVSSREAKREAERCVEALNGVVDVMNGLTIKKEEDH